MLGELDMRFFKTPGNHDIANTTAKEEWRERYGATYYYFIYKDVLFMVLDTEYNRPAPPPDMKEKLELYNRLQVEDPAKAQAMLAEFMSEMVERFATNELLLVGMINKSAHDESYNFV